VLRFAADENFNNDILRALARRSPELDVVRVQDVPGLRGADDAAVLEWASREQRLVLTHDVATMPRCAEGRLRACLPMPGLIAVPRQSFRPRVVEDLLLVAELSTDREWEGQVLFVPL